MVSSDRLHQPSDGLEAAMYYDPIFFPSGHAVRRMDLGSEAASGDFQFGTR